MDFVERFSQALQATLGIAPVDSQTLLDAYMFEDAGILRNWVRRSISSCEGVGNPSNQFREHLPFACLLSL